MTTCPMNYYDTWGYWDGGDSPVQVQLYQMQVNDREYYYYHRNDGAVYGPFDSPQDAYDNARGY